MAEERALSASNAMRCEQALYTNCECRCGGAFHGANRGLVSDLPTDDPHSPSSACEVCNGKGEIKERRKIARRQEDGDPTRRDRISCPNCGGTGKAIKKATMKKLLLLERLQAEGRWP